jgi:hypothetical protein
MQMPRDAGAAARAGRIQSRWDGDIRRVSPTPRRSRRRRHAVTSSGRERIPLAGRRTCGLSGAQVSRWLDGLINAAARMNRSNSSGRLADPGGRRRRSGGTTQVYQKAASATPAEIASARSRSAFSRSMADILHAPGVAASCHPAFSGSDIPTLIPSAEFRKSKSKAAAVRRHLHRHPGEF